MIIIPECRYLEETAPYSVHAIYDEYSISSTTFVEVFTEIIFCKKGLLHKFFFLFCVLIFLKFVIVWCVRHILMF